METPVQFHGLPLGTGLQRRNEKVPTKLFIYYQEIGMEIFLVNWFFLIEIMKYMIDLAFFF